MEAIMHHVGRFLAISAIVGGFLLGWVQESWAIEEVPSARVADTKAGLRDLWSGHIFWMRNVMLANAMNDAAARDVAEKEVVTNAKQIADTIKPFYGETASEKLFGLLAEHYGAVREYSDAAISGNESKQNAAVVHLTSNAEEIASFLSGANPYLPKGTVLGLIAAHGSQHMAQIRQFQQKDYGHEAETWQVMRQHIYMVSDAITTALAKQFPNKFL